MSIPMSKSFSITDRICPTTGKPFGDKYAGVFSIRRPSLLDKRNIAVKDAAALSQYGDLSDGTLSRSMQLISYIFSFVSIAATEPVPEWFDMSKMFEKEDEDAALAVWNEVGNFLDSFRPKTAGGDGGSGGE